MELHSITSEMFSHHGYDNGEIHLTFKNGGNTYAYPITPAQYADFQAAPSAGKWFHRNIKNKIEGRKVQLAAAV